MPNKSEGIDPTKLPENDQNAYDILVNMTADDLAKTKGLLKLGSPDVVGNDTVTAYVKCCGDLKLDLGNAGIHAFKAANKFDDTGANAGAIGPTTAHAWAQTVFDKSAPPAPPSTGRHTTDTGVKMIENFEGLRLSAYIDAVGVATIGYGHTAGVQMGQTITQPQAEEFLRQDLGVAEKAVCADVKVPLNDNQFDALVSFTFNCGTGALGSSTLLKKLNAGDYQGAADQFLVWVNGSNGPLPGLVDRRNKERALFLTPM